MDESFQTCSASTPYFLHQSSRGISPATRTSQPYTRQYESPYTPLQPDAGENEQARPVESIPPGLPDQPDVSRHRERRASLACENCRSFKSRCVIDPGKTDCKRCIKANRECRIPQSNRRRAGKKERKQESPERASHKIAELEGHIQSLTRELATARNEAFNASDEQVSCDGKGETPSGTYSSSSPRTVPFIPSLYDETMLRPPHHAWSHDRHSNLTLSNTFSSSPASSRQKRMPGHDAHASTWQAHVAPNMARPTAQRPADRCSMALAEQRLVMPPDIRDTGIAPYRHGHADVLERYFPNAADSDSVFYHYARWMAPQIPIVVFPEYTNPEEINATKPTLFLAILSVAAPVEVQIPLSTKVLHILGDLIIVNNEKSLELIQALQVITLWHFPPFGTDALYDQYCSIATTMLQYLGMGTPSEDNMHWSSWSAKHPEIAGEGARAYVGCFIIDSITAMGQKRSSVSWAFDKTFVDHVIDALNSSYDASPFKAAVGHWAHLLQILYHPESPLKKGFIDNEWEHDNWQCLLASIANRQAQLQRWYAQVPGHHNAKVRTVGFHAISLYISQPAAQLRLMLAQLRCNVKEEENANSARDPSVFRRCVAEFHRFFESFLRLPEDGIRAIPIFQLTHITHAIFLLVMVQKVVESINDKDQQPCQAEELKIQLYVDRMVSLLREITVERPSRSVMSFMMLLTILQDWIHQHSPGVSALPPSASRKVGESTRALEAGSVSFDREPLHVLNQEAAGIPKSTYNEASDLYSANAGTTVDTLIDEDPTKGNSLDLPVMRSGLGSALRLVLDQGDIDLGYFGGFLTLVETASSATEKEKE